MRPLVGAVAFALLAACSPTAATGPAVEQWHNVEVRAVPIEFGAEQVGRLAFRGGLHLQADDLSFTGVSGFEVLDDGQVVAHSDESDWIEARLELDADGRLIGFTDVRTAWMRDERGRPFASKAEGDSEGLTQLPDGRFAVSFERSHVIRIYDLNRDGPFGSARMGPALAGVERLPANTSLEALAATADGVLLAGAEGGDRDTTPLWLAPLDAPAPVASRFNYPLRDGFSLTGLDRLPDGGFVAVERFYAPIIGAHLRISRIAPDAFSGEGGTIETEELARISPPFPVDNFEGISAVRMPNGATRIYIISDDNTNRRQRTLLLAFDLVEADAD